ncbi:MAG TPA: lipocalin-like domain-containing protein [Alphaproteobacteria bacterium]|nr:lipocalin-like domain-containing protein [Alphaproteobacteria bacterium]
MKAYVRLALAALMGVVLALGAANGTSAQETAPKISKRQIVGTWAPASIDNVAKDGSHLQPYGANPKGIFIFARNGRFAEFLLRPDLPKYASNDRMTGTAEENKATVQGSVSFFGTYTVDAKNRTLILHVEGSSFPNQSGSDQKRLITKLTADELAYTNPTPSSGVTANLVWKRVK